MNSYDALADWYDSLTEDVDYEGLHDYICAIMKRRGVLPRRILDMACGTGSLSLLFAEEGYHVQGIDLSPDMVRRAQAKADELQLSVTYTCGDMADFTVSQPVDLLVCMLDSFNYLTTLEKGRSAICGFASALTPGGLLIFDIRPPKQLRLFDGEMFMDETEDVFCVWRTEFDEAENLCYYGMDIFVREGEHWVRHQEEHIEYAFEPDWLKSELEAAGFTDVEIYGERTFLQPQPDEERVFIIARKRDNNE